MPQIEYRFLGHPARILVSVPTELWFILYK
jgi:hypothetical protein